MTEPRLPVNDFERWVAASAVPPDQRDPDALCDGIAAAIRSRDFKAVIALLHVLALRDPRKAQAAHDMVLAACEGDERKAILLAVLGD